LEKSSILLNKRKNIHNTKKAMNRNCRAFLT